MKITEYANLALRSIKPHENKQSALSDWGLGLSGEAAEVIEWYRNSTMQYAQGEIWTEEDRMEFAKEIGDVLWYSVAVLWELNLSPEEMDFNDLLIMVPLTEQPKISGVYEAMTVAMMTGGVCEHLKHHIAHKEELKTEQISQLMKNLWINLHLLCVYQNFDLQTVAELNIAKLSHRYNLTNAEGFTYQASADRHEAEKQFTDTDEYAALKERILGGKVCE